MDRRTQEWNTVSGLMQAQTDDVLTVPEYQTNGACHVCSAPDRNVPNGWAVRNLVDELLLVPKTYSSVMRLIEPLMESWPEDSKISRYGLMRHSQRHLAWEKSAAREIAERRAQDVGKGDAVGRMLTAATVLEAVQQRGFEALVSGEITPSVKDTISASSALREIERESEGEYTVADALSQLDTVIQIIREIVPQEYHEAIVDRLDAGKTPSPPPPDSDPAWDEIVDEMGEDAFK